MSQKSRANWNIPICIKKCINKDILCHLCFKFSHYMTKEQAIKNMGDGTDPYVEGRKDLNQRDGFS